MSNKNVLKHEDRPKDYPEGNVDGKIVMLKGNRNSSPPPKVDDWTPEHHAAFNNSLPTALEKLKRWLSN